MQVLPGRYASAEVRVYKERLLFVRIVFVWLCKLKRRVPKENTKNTQHRNCNQFIQTAGKTVPVKAINSWEL